MKLPWNRPAFAAVHLALTAFVTGASVMAVEITSARVLAPYFGTSIMVWTSLIVSNLLGLSFGYWVGGKAASGGKDPRKTLGLSLAGGALLLAFGVWMVQSFSLAVSGYFFEFTASTFFLFLGSLIVSFTIFAVPVFLVAIAGPIIVKEWTRASGGDVGAVAGRYFAVSTLGSVVGTVLPTLVLVPSIGTRATVGLVSLALAFVAMPFLSPRGRWALAAFMLYALALMSMKMAAIDETVRYSTESPYQLIRVMDSADGMTHIRGDAVIMSVFAPDGGRTYAYYDYLGVLPFWSRGAVPEGRDFGIIGFAAGSIARQYRTAAPDDRSTSIQGVDVDPRMIAIGERFFGTGDLGAETVVGDGRMFLLDTDRRFDALAFDAYSAVSAPPHLVSREFFSLARSRLKEGGIIGMNVLAPSWDQPLIVAIANTLASVFEHVRIVPVGGSIWNYIVLASDDPLEPDALAGLLPAGYEDIGDALRYRSVEVIYDPDALVMTDDFAPTEFMTDAMAIAQAFK